MSRADPGYDRMRLVESNDFGIHGELPAGLSMLQDSIGLIQSESMDLTNDPRFFQGNVLNKRLAAFSGLSVVSGLMVGTASGVISMKKDINFQTYEGVMQLVSFSLMAIVLFLNVIATYVGVAQIYHVYRLETAGPTGFEMATSYYLNPNIVAWRHLAVKCMLNGMPIFLISSGIRICVNFERSATEEVVQIDPLNARILGIVFLTIFAIKGWLMWYVHCVHVAVFKDNYQLAKERELPYLRSVQNMMNGRRKGTGVPDV